MEPNTGLPVSDMHRWDHFVLIVYGIAIVLFGGYMMYLYRLRKQLEETE
jgi:hypothetical protein